MVCEKDNYYLSLHVKIELNNTLLDTEQKFTRVLMIWSCLFLTDDSEIWILHLLKNK